MKTGKGFLAAALRKLRGRGGDTIPEVLVALLISAVALVMLASMIAVSRNLIVSSEETMERYYQANTDLTLQTDTVANPALSGTVAFLEKKAGSEGNRAVHDPVTVSYRYNNVITVTLAGKKTRIIAYWK